MAYRRSICTRATLLARRLNPSFSYISHDLDEKKNNKRIDEPGCRKIDDFLTQGRSFGTCIGNRSGPGKGFRSYGSVLGGVGAHRYMSTFTGEGAEKVEYLSDAVASVSDGTVEAIASQVQVLSEVEVAATGSAVPVAALQFVIDYVHTFTGLNWAASIALTTFLIRGATVPLLINQLKSTSKLAKMNPRLVEIKEEMDAKANDPVAAQECRLKMNALFKEHGVTPFTPLKGMLIQGPVFISFFLAISNMAEKVPSFKNGGAFWFTDLTTPDPMYILPVLAGLMFLITVEFNMQEGMEGNTTASTMKKFSRGLAVLTVPFTMNFPKALFCYWITSNIFSFVYGSVLKIPSVREALGVPKIPINPPSTSNKQGSQSGFSLLKALQQAADSWKSPAIPTASTQSKMGINGKTLPSSPSSSSAVLSQKVKSLEKQVKKRKKNKRRV